MKSGIAAAFALALMVGSTMTQAKEPELVRNSKGLTDTVLTMRVRGDLTFGPDGVIKEHHLSTTKLDPVVAAFIDESIGRWKFKPVDKDGAPVNGKTYFQMTVIARPRGDNNYALSVDNARFSDDPTLGMSEYKQKGKGKCVTNCILSRPPMPSYPVGIGVSAGVMVHLYLNPDGTVADARVAQSALYGVRDDDEALNDARKQFEKVALAYVKHIRFAPGSGSALRGDEHRAAALPFIFQMQGTVTSNLGEWRLEQRSQRNFAPWLASNPDRWIGASDTDGGGFVAMEESKYKLTSGSDRAP